MIETVEQVAAADLAPGDEVWLPKRGWKCVSSVDLYDDGATVIVCYFAEFEGVYENRARDKSGFHERARLCELSLAERDPAALLTAKRGPAERAATLRARMAREQVERARVQEAKWAKMSARMATE